MTPEQIELARAAMALPGAPSVPNWPKFFAWYGHDNPCNGVGAWAWNISDTSPAGWALGGVLLGSLGPNKQITHNKDGSVTIHFHQSAATRIQYVKGQTLSEACCRVALANGCWPGGMTSV